MVFAAASLADVLPLAAADFESAGGPKVRFHFAASTTLANQIRRGLPADLFIAASPRAANRVAGATQTLASNHLVLVVRDPELTQLAWPESLSSLDKIAIGNPETAPVGEYAMKALESFDLGRRLIPTANARAALASTERGVAQAAVVYATDAATSQKVQLAYRFPLSEPIEYVAVVPDGRPQGRPFLDYLISADGQKRFREAGFQERPPGE